MAGPGERSPGSLPGRIAEHLRKLVAASVLLTAAEQRALALVLFLALLGIVTRLVLALTDY